MKNFLLRLVLVFSVAFGAVKQAVQFVANIPVKISVFLATTRALGLDYMESKKWLQTMWQAQPGKARVGGMEALLGITLVAVIVYIVLTNVWPSMQDANSTIQANTATDSGTKMSKVIFNLLLWIVPIGIGLAMILKIIKR